MWIVIMIKSSDIIFLTRLLTPVSIWSFLSVFFFRSQYFFVFSLGCGIGYGYLHRVPTLPFVEDKKVSFPARTPSVPAPPAKDGFTEVTRHAKQRHNCIIWMSPGFQILWTFIEMRSFWFAGPSLCCHSNRSSWCVFFCIDCIRAASRRLVS